jgi:DNA-binding IscR family transcriptional regulator
VCSRESGRVGSDSICPTKLLWTRVRGSIVRTLQDTTLADLLVTQRPHTLTTALPTLPSTPQQTATSAA